jgi:hypothetical protein
MTTAVDKWPAAARLVAVAAAGHLPHSSYTTSRGTTRYQEQTISKNQPQCRSRLGITFGVPSETLLAGKQNQRKWRDAMSNFTNKRVIPAATLILLLGTAAYATSIHLKGTPTFTDNGLSLTASGSIAGLGNAPTSVFLNAQANVAATCTNHGQHQAPGQNPAPISVTGSVTLDPSNSDKNGNVSFNVTTNPPPSEVAGAPDCPNSGWTEAINDLSFTSANIVVGSTTVASCTFSPPTDNGPVPKNEVSCQ